MGLSLGKVLGYAAQLRAHAGLPYLAKPARTLAFAFASTRNRALAALGYLPHMRQKKGEQMSNTEILKFNLFNLFNNNGKEKDEAKAYLKGMLMGALITDAITIEEFEELKELLTESNK